jgi:hypothetical protein
MPPPSPASPSGRLFDRLNEPVPGITGENSELPGSMGAPPASYRLAESAPRRVICDRSVAGHFSKESEDEHNDDVLTQLPGSPGNSNEENL